MSINYSTLEADVAEWMKGTLSTSRNTVAKVKPTPRRCGCLRMTVAGPAVVPWRTCGRPLEE